MTVSRGEVRRRVETSIVMKYGMKWCALHDAVASHGPDPFLSELRGDNTHYWQCEECRAASAREI